MTPLINNTNLENGGSLYGVGTGNATDCSNPLNDASCSGYAACLSDSTMRYRLNLYNECVSFTIGMLMMTNNVTIRPTIRTFLFGGYSQQNSVAYL